MLEHDDDAVDRQRRVDAAYCQLLAYVLVPTWLVTGLLDWHWHRGTTIERTSGAHESLTHLLMAAEGGLGVTLGLFTEIDAGIILTMVGAGVAHEATVVWDVNYTKRRRVIDAAEDRTHKVLEALPFVIAASATWARRPQMRALLGLGGTPQFAFRLRRPPLPAATVPWFSPQALFGVGPFAEEFVPCLRVQSTLAPLPAPNNNEDLGSATCDWSNSHRISPGWASAT